MKILVTGGAGFIGSQLCERLLNDGHKVVCVDDMSAGTIDNLMGILTNPNFIFVRMDVNNVDDLTNLICANKIEQIYHLAANSSISEGNKNTAVDFERTFKTTFSVLEAMKRADVKKLFFSSTSAVYGDKENQPMVENMGELLPENYYGGAKLASEAYISSFAKMNGFDVMIFRFANVIGPHLTHGVIFDFIKKLQKNPTELEILGDGNQTKPYIYSLDLIDAICQKTYQMPQGINVYNCGVESCTSVKQIADIVCKKLGLENVTYNFTGEKCGWKGDVPNYQFDISKLKDTGWVATYSSDEAVEKTVEDWLNKEIVANNIRCTQIVKTVKARYQQRSTNLFLSREYQLQARVEQMLKQNEQAKKVAFEKEQAEKQAAEAEAKKVEETKIEESKVEPAAVEQQVEQQECACCECEQAEQPKAAESTTNTEDIVEEKTEQQGTQLLFDIFEETENAEQDIAAEEEQDADTVMENEAKSLEEEFVDEISLENIPNNTEEQAAAMQDAKLEIFEEEQIPTEDDTEKTVIVMNEDDTENFVFDFEKEDEEKSQE